MLEDPKARAGFFFGKRYIVLCKEDRDLGVEEGMNGQMGRAFGKLARACACVCRGIACRWRQVDPAHHAGLGLLHPPFLISRCRRKGHSMNNIESTLSLGKISPEPCYLMEELSFLGEPMRERVHTMLYTSFIRTETAPAKTPAYPSTHYL